MKAYNINNNNRDTNSYLLLLYYHNKEYGKMLYMMEKCIQLKNWEIYMFMALFDIVTRSKHDKLFTLRKLCKKTNKCSHVNRLCNMSILYIIIFKASINIQEFLN